MARYVDELALELRNLDLPGYRIGAVVAEVEAHVAESGDDPADAFGPPREYAQLVASAVSDRRGFMSWPMALRAAGVGTGGFLLMDGIVALVAGRPANVTPGTVAALVLLPVVAVIAVRVISRTPAGPGAAVTGRWVAATTALVVAVVALGSLPALVDAPVLASYPGWFGVIVGIALIVPILAVTVARHADPVIDPRTGRNIYRRAWLIWAAMSGLLALEVAAVALAVGALYDQP